MSHGYPITVGLVLALASGCSDSGNVDSQNMSGSGPGAGTSSGGATSGGAGAATTAGSSGSANAGSSSTAGAGGGSSGGVSGSGGASAGMGGSGGASAPPAKPVLRDGEWAFDLGEVTLQVDPQLGGRITTFELGGENLLTGPEVNATYWGSTLWTSPEVQWTHPPPAPIDSAAYAAVATDTTLTLTGQPYPMLGVSVTKTFTTDPALGAFKIEYKLTNTLQTTIQMAPWEVTRVVARGLTFFPTGPSMSLSMGATMPTTNIGGITWYAYDMNAVTKDSKLYADAAEGWLAHVAQGLVFIKSFGDVPANKIAANEGDVELYTNALHTYIELENQGAYADIAGGASTSWTVTWFLRKLPAGLEATAGNAALATFVRDTIAGK